MIRANIVSDFIKGLYGPENGINEEISQSPLKKYITGILSPESPVLRDPDQEQGIIYEESIGREQNLDIFDKIPDYIQSSPALNPQNKPRSLGLSFNAQSDGVPVIRICVTWGRYYYNEKKWLRNSYGYISNEIICNPGKDQILLDKEGKLCGKEKCEASILVYTREIRKNVFFISVYFTNRIKITGRYATSQEYLYQPQIRINLIKGETTSLNNVLPINVEDREVQFLYRNYKTPVRGHMCSVIWKEIDPEREYSKKNNKNPFSWIDGETVMDHPSYADFILPDLRTEYLPSFNIESPDYTWPVSKNKPLMHPKDLSNLWDPKKLVEGLNPFIKEYNEWINSINEDDYPPLERDVVKNLKENNNQVLKRIKKGINLLESNDDVRLSFCFANRVIFLQNKWKGDNYPWRAFQLAFILYSLESIANDASEERDVCDLLIVPTGAGKTEAYLGLAAFSMAYRRIKAKHNELIEDGCDVLMRYTLRLLTIQQYRRALLMILACEYLRVKGIQNKKPIGWRPVGYESNEDFIWGTTRFSIGLWVGGQVSPNRLSNIQGGRRVFPGAIEILREEDSKGEGEPAQILECPVCDSVLSIPKSGIKTNRLIMHLIVKIKENSDKINEVFGEDFGERLRVIEYDLIDHKNEFYTLKLDIGTDLDTIISKDFDKLVKRIIDECHKKGIKISLRPVRASRPGYFLKYEISNRGIPKPVDFEIFCPNPHCALHDEKGIWIEAVPIHHKHNKKINVNGRIISEKEKEYIIPPDFTKIGDLSKKIPIVAYTVDEQVYNKCPSFIVATVDKIARLPYEPRVASMFGNVSHYDINYGYYREGAPTLSYRGSGKHRTTNVDDRIKVNPLHPPNLIIQDELHLIEGPLGSMVGIYETLIDYLGSRKNTIKYIASTATVKGAMDQVNSIFARRLSKFPNPINEISERFFIKFKSNNHQLSEDGPGRLYIGICSPGWGSLTPVYRIWGRLLQSAFECSYTYSQELVDYFWTLVGYFNSIRELAGTRNMYRQDIPVNVKTIAINESRNLPDDRVIELSSRKDSTELPSLLNEVSKSYSGNPNSPNTPDALFTTSMFGTGVDITRLSMMIMHGQPKTTSAYIQSTGRVGRRKGGLVVTIYSPTKPRDLNHYEMFCGYHTKMDMFVEPITVVPFAPGTLHKCLGPVIIGTLRSKLESEHPWHMEDTALDIRYRTNTSDINSLINVFKNHIEYQPELRKIPLDEFELLLKSEIDNWESKAERIAASHEKLKYVEYTSTSSHVVLGDPEHKHEGLIRVFDNAPNSLRDIEETTGFQVRDRG
ncbi:MAG: DISARM system helicase DrmA [Candidatus Odinarchaeia archaeon]